MTIDESIERFKALAEKGHIIFSKDPDIAEKLNKEYRQVAEWLEELKAYREQHQALCDAYDVNTVEDIYDKAIDDFIKSVDKHCGYYLPHRRSPPRRKALSCSCPHHSQRDRPCLFQARRSTFGYAPHCPHLPCHEGNDSASAEPATPKGRTPTEPRPVQRRAPAP